MANTLDRLSSNSTLGTQNSATSNTNTGTTQVSKDMFLQLLVAQIQNQDPLNPSDGVQFLTQLAQFQQLENGLNMAQDIAAIRSDLDKAAGTSTTN